MCRWALPAGSLAGVRPRLPGSCPPASQLGVPKASCAPGPLSICTHTHTLHRGSLSGSHACRLRPSRLPPRGIVAAPPFGLLVTLLPAESQTSWVRGSCVSPSPAGSCLPASPLMASARSLLPCLPMGPQLRPALSMAFHLLCTGSLGGFSAFEDSLRRCGGPKPHGRPQVALRLAQGCGEGL